MDPRAQFVRRENRRSVLTGNGAGREFPYPVHSAEGFGMWPWDDGNELPRVIQVIRVKGSCTFGFLQDRDVGVGVFPEGQEILIRAFCFGHVAVDRVGSAKLEMGERTKREVHHDAAMVEKLLELGGCGIAITCR